MIVWNRQAAVFNCAQSAREQARMMILTCPNVMAIGQPGFKKNESGKMRRREAHPGAAQGLAQAREKGRRRAAFDDEVLR